MKILHIADLHLGKKLCGLSRINEQREVLGEINEIADREKADVIIAAGDIFDSLVPSAESEELFYESALAFAKNRYFIAIAGNHDDEKRLSAPQGIAKHLNIFLIGDYDNSKYSRANAEGGYGFLKIKIEDEILNLAVMPYPHHSRLASSENKGDTYSGIVKERLKDITSGFSENSFNVIASHLFMTRSGKELTAEEMSDERELGTASLLPSSVLPKADYTALGHIHKPMTVSKSGNVFYSGSILNYDFSDTSEKSVIIADMKFNEDKTKNIEVKRVPLIKARKLITIEADTFEKAKEALNNNPDCYVHIVYNGEKPLFASEMSELKKNPSFAKIENIFKEKKEAKSFRERSAKEMFCDFYKKTYGTGKEPPANMLQMFLDVINEGGEKQ